MTCLFSSLLSAVRYKKNGKAPLISSTFLSSTCIIVSCYYYCMMHAPEIHPPYCMRLYIFLEKELSQDHEKKCFLPLLALVIKGQIKSSGYTILGGLQFLSVQCGMPTNGETWNRDVLRHLLQRWACLAFLSKKIKPKSLLQNWELSSCISIKYKFNFFVTTLYSLGMIHSR